MCEHNKFEVLYFQDGIIIRRCMSCGEIEVKTELPSIMFEKVCIRHIFKNLLDNAIKYMDKPKGQVIIGCVEENDFWKFSVADNGPGIEQKYFSKIFWSDGDKLFC